MKYTHFEVTPEIEDLNDWVIKKSKNITLIINKYSPFGDSNKILFHKRNGQLYIVTGETAATPHIRLLNILVKILKVPTDTTFIDCVLGDMAPFSKTYKSGNWLKTVPVIDRSRFTRKEIMSADWISPSDPQFKQIETVENIVKKFIYTNKIILPKPVLKRRTEEEGKIKLPQKVKLKLPLRKLK